MSTSPFNLITVCSPTSLVDTSSSKSTSWLSTRIKSGCTEVVAARLLLLGPLHERVAAWAPGLVLAGIQRYAVAAVVTPYPEDLLAHLLVSVGSSNHPPTPPVFSRNP